MTTDADIVPRSDTPRRGIDPLSLLGLLCVLVALVSAVGAASGWSAPNLATGETVRVTSMFAPENIRRLIADMPRTFFGFAPLGMVVLIMMGSGVAERSGLISTALSAALRNVPRHALTPSIVLVGILAHIGTDAAYFVVIPFAGYAFAAAGRHPLAGVVAAFAGVGGGYGANLLVTPTDVVVYTLTENAARVVNPATSIDIFANYFMLAAFAVVVIAIVTLLTDRWMEPRIATRYPMPVQDQSDRPAVDTAGLGWAGIAVLAILAGGLALGLAPGAPLRDPETGLKPFYASFIAIIAFALLAGGLTFAVRRGTVRSDSDAYALMRDALADTAPFLLLVFFAAHFSAFLEWTHLAQFAAAQAAQWLRSIALTGTPLILAFFLLTAVLNLVLPSTSAKWALMAPAAVPMMMSLGISPEMTAAAYRLGASASELVTPTAMMPIVLLFAQRYVPRMGLGTFIALMVPYTVALLAASAGLLVLWAGLDLPLGPTGAHALIEAPAR